MLDFLHVVNCDQLIEHERAQKEDRANTVREPSEKQLEFARYYANIKSSMLGNRGRMNPFKLLTENGVFTKPLPVDAGSFETVNAIDFAIAAVTAKFA